MSHLRQGLLRREPNQAPSLVTLREEAVPVPPLRVGLLSEVQHGPPPGQPCQGNYKTVLRIRIRDSGFSFTPGSGIRIGIRDEKKKIRIRHNLGSFYKSLITIFGLKKYLILRQFHYCGSGSGNWDAKNPDPGSRIYRTSRIRNTGTRWDFLTDLNPSPHVNNE